MGVINQVVDQIILFMTTYGIFLGGFIIILESIIPILPLSVFITLNVASYGGIFGILISWIATIFGCSISFFVFRKCFRKKFSKLMKNKDWNNISKMMKEMDKIKFSNLSLLMAIPFSPAFIINIAAGLSKIEYKKFFYSLCIGKLIMVYFWGYIGTSLMESLKDIDVFFKIIGMLILAFSVSKFVEKKFKIK